MVTAGSVLTDVGVRTVVACPTPPGGAARRAGELSTLAAGISIAANRKKNH